MLRVTFFVCAILASACASAYAGEPAKIFAQPQKLEERSVKRDNEVKPAGLLPAPTLNKTMAKRVLESQNERKAFYVLDMKVYESNPKREVGKQIKMLSRPKLMTIANQDFNVQIAQHVTAPAAAELSQSIAPISIGVAIDGMIHEKKNGDATLRLKCTSTETEINDSERLEVSSKSKEIIAKVKLGQTEKIRIGRESRDGTQLWCEVVINEVVQ